MRIGSFLLSTSPGAAGQQYQHGEYLQSACQHIDDQYEFGKTAVSGEIAGRTHSFQTGTDIVKAGEHSGNVGACGEAVDTDDQKA